MSYIGNQPPDIGAYDVESFDGGGTSFTLKRAATVSSVLLFIDGVRQTPTDAYTVSGVTLTTTATTLSGTDNVTVMFMGDVVDIGAPSADTVSTVKIQDDAVTAAKLANSINTEITANTAKVTNATHTGDVTGATALTIAANAVTLAKLEDGTQGDILYYGASGAPTRLGFGTTGDFLKTQGTGANPVWATAGGDNTPAFQAYLSATDTGHTAESWGKLECDTEDFDTDSAYDNSTNYRFTVPAGETGKYFISGAVAVANGNGDGEIANIAIYVNGSAEIRQDSEETGGGSYGWENTSILVSGILTLSATDYVELYAYTRSQNGGGTPFITGGADRFTRFFGYKMIGL